ncbi:hypothetical protein CRV01_10170 [Arcobacter sp. CECT 8983]|uniref:hypothetical protein n=1 Tax=Arcobacter sp. CECT 8983 TaxID=2044508 RepID=UPI00100BACD2|nr:hypothetical protein [Arcobacter sp. CECT 8983]RXJ88978.1 hypothetical protein CRV01_10170 [Arcobacter sp. CECT 8983]
MIVEPASQSNYYFTNNESKKEISTKDTIFEEELTNTQVKEEDTKPLEIEKSTEELVEDIISLLKTGFTKDELEAIEKLKEEILAKIKEEKENGTGDLKTIEKLLAKLEKMIDELKRSVNGVIIKDADEIKEKQDNMSDDKELSSTLKEAISKLEELSTEIKELTKLKKDNKQHLNTQEELLLMQELKNS